jgi:class 3 adenylate cyclase
MDVARWLQALGCEQYAAAFLRNDVTGDILSSLTEQDLRDLGVLSVGHRRRMLDAIAALRDNASAPDLSAGSTGERRQISVMFCDLVGSAALSTRLEPEDLQELLRGYQARVRAAVARFGGHIARYVGDGVLTYFGWPVASEADPERAVRAALAVAAAVRETPVCGEQLAARIGIASGLVVVGEPIGAGDSRQHTATGETPNLRRRSHAATSAMRVFLPGMRRSRH